VQLAASEPPVVLEVLVRIEEELVGGGRVRWNVVLDADLAPISLQIDHN
jgi:hypothetical protein